MKMIKRFIYLIYYIKEGEFAKVKPLMDHASKITAKSRTRIFWESLIDVFKYNISIKDYYYFRFFEKDSIEKGKWAGTGTMYEYQLKMNPLTSRSLLENKIEFLKSYTKFIKRGFATLKEIEYDQNKGIQLIENRTGKLVLKGSTGQVGAEVEVRKCADFTVEKLIAYMKLNNFDLVEEFVVQHNDLMSLSPSGLNTVRIFTQLKNGEVAILGSRLRVSVNSPVDNMAAGNLAAPLNSETGVVNGKAVYSDIRKQDCEKHPITNKPITGFQVPYWDEVLKMVKQAAFSNTANKSIGWDVAIGVDGPELIEGNHNWCKALWQLPVKKGLKDNLVMQS